MPRNFGPMLAAKINDDDMIFLEDFLKRNIKFPVLASPKIDGIRFMVKDGVAMSRSWKPLPNRHFQGFIQSIAEDAEGLDGEVIVGYDPSAFGLFNRTQSAIMTRDWVGDFSCHIFDTFKIPQAPFNERTRTAEANVSGIHDLGVRPEMIQYVPHTSLLADRETTDYETAAIEAGFEGIMLRGPNNPYKFGRSTLREGGLIKVKRFVDDEARIIGFKALERNTNPPQKDAFGLQKRSSHKAGKVAEELLGKIVVNHTKFGEFEIGSGFDVATREEIWQNQASYLNRLVTFKYQVHGVKDKPRSPIFKGIRSDLDT